MTKITEYLAEQKRLAEAATEGPWEARHRKSLDWLSKVSGDETHQPGSGVAIAGAVEAHLSSLWPNRNAHADAEFIAAARSSVPRMIAALEAVEDLIETTPDDGCCESCEGYSGAMRDIKQRIEAALGGEGDGREV